MRKILVPTDFSENALNALEYAISLFKYDRSDFFIMHAYQDDIYANDIQVTRDTISEVTNMVSTKSKTQLEALLKHIKKISPNPA